MRDVLNRRFWISYVVILIITLPIPLLTLEGEAETVRRVPVGRCYLNILTFNATAWDIVAVLAHLAVVFIISYAMRRTMLWGLQGKNSEDAGE